MWLQNADVGSSMYLDVSTLSAKSGKQYTGKQKRAQSSVSGLCPAAVSHHQHAHLLFVTSPDNDLCYLHIPSTACYMNPGQGSWQVKVCAKWYEYLCLHMQLDWWMTTKERPKSGTGGESVVGQFFKGNFIQIHVDKQTPRWKVISQEMKTELWRRDNIQLERRKDLNTRWKSWLKSKKLEQDFKEMRHGSQSNVKLW